MLQPRSAAQRCATTFANLRPYGNVQWLQCPAHPDTQTHTRTHPHTSMRGRKPGGSLKQGQPSKRKMLLAAQRRSAPTPTKCALRFMHSSLKTSQVEHQGACKRGGVAPARGVQMGVSIGQLRGSNKRHRRRYPGPQHSPEMAQWCARPCASIYLDDLHRVPPPQKGQPLPTRPQTGAQGELEQLELVWDDGPG